MRNSLGRSSCSGRDNCRSVRTVCDRLLLVAYVILEKGELFNKQFKKPLEAAAA